MITEDLKLDIPSPKQMEVALEFSLAALEQGHGSKKTNLNGIMPTITGALRESGFTTKNAVFNRDDQKVVYTLLLAAYSPRAGLACILSALHDTGFEKALCIKLETDNAAMHKFYK